MHNKNVQDEVKRTLEHKVCIGKLLSYLETENVLEF